MKKLLSAIILLLLLPSISFSFESNLSTDPNDLAPIMGTIWKFEYPRYGLTMSSTIAFDNELYINPNTGKVAIGITDLLWIGAAQYGDFPGFPGERGFICLLVDPPPTNQSKIYLFTVSGDTATGHYCYMDDFDTSDAYLAPMIGAKIGNLSPERDKNQPVIDPSEDPAEDTIKEDKNPPTQPAQEEQEMQKEAAPIEQEQDGNDGGGGMGCFIETIIKEK